MNNAPGFIEILIMVALGWFIFSRFTSHNLPKEGKEKGGNPNVIPLPGKEKEDVKISLPKGMSWEGAREVMTATPAFRPDSFLNGAREAFQLYMTAYSEADEDTLENLLSPVFFDQVMDEIEEAREKKQARSFKVVALNTCTLLRGEVRGRTVLLDVKYEAEVETKIGKRKAKRETLSQVWTWARAADSEDPNWQLQKIMPIV